MGVLRFGQLGKLKPEKIEEYCALHANPWPEVLETIKQCNMRNYSIYLHGDLVLLTLSMWVRILMPICRRWITTPLPKNGGSIRTPASWNMRSTRQVSFTTI